MDRRTVLATLGLGLSGGCLRMAGSSDPEGTTSEITGSTTTSKTQTSTQTTESTTTEETTTTEEPTAKIEKVWERHVGAGYFIRHQHIDGDLITGTLEDSIVRMSQADGSIVWEQSLPGENSDTDSTVTLSDGQIFLGTLNNFYALDAETGKIQWEAEIPAEESELFINSIKSQVHSGIVLFGFSYKYTSEGDSKAGLCGVDASSGEILWVKTHSDIADQFDAWLGIQALSPPIQGRSIVGGWNEVFWIDFKTGEIDEEALYDSRYRYAQSGDIIYSVNVGNIHAYLIESGELTPQWNFEPLGRAQTPLTVDGNVIYFAADDEGVYAVSEGEQLWRYHIKSTPYAAPVVSDSVVWAGKSNLHAIDKESGRGLADVEVERISVLSANSEYVFVSSHSTTGAYELISQ